MAAHLTLVSLRRALSAQGGVSEKVADDFLGALLATIQEGLQKDGEVSINGLGTFKLQDVPARESVNVATGERITINGYKKVAFSTETTKRASKPADDAIDPIRKLGEQAEEIKGILSELGAMSAEGTALSSTDSTEQTEETVQESTVVVSPEPQPEEPQPQEQPKEQPKEPQPTSKPFNPWLTGLITIGVFAMLLVVAYFILRHQIISWANNMHDTIEQRISATPDEKPAPAAEFAQPQEEQAPQASDEPEATQEVTESQEPEQVAPATTQAELPDFFDDSKRQFTEFQAVETVGKDSRLAWVAKKHYGEKALWVFIYEANRNKINDPDLVLPGTKLRIPKLPADLRDVNNPDTKALLDRLSDKYLGN